MMLFFFYCDTAEEFYMDEKLLQENDIRLKMHIAKRKPFNLF